jgi:hypothetical protein
MILVGPGAAWPGAADTLGLGTYSTYVHVFRWCDLMFHCGWFIFEGNILHITKNDIIGWVQWGLVQCGLVQHGLVQHLF